MGRALLTTLLLVTAVVDHGQRANAPANTSLTVQVLGASIHRMGDAGPLLWQTPRPRRVRVKVGRRWSASAEMDSLGSAYFSGMPAGIAHVWCDTMWAKGRYEETIQWGRTAVIRPGIPAFDTLRVMLVTFPLSR